ncbi:MAG: hypothetical protein J5955_01985 [Bacilli bacterium]|nr:hypothetical protein [Bacilli bacterium]
MAKKFQKLSRLVQVLLLLIPVVNFFTEVIVRVSALLEKPTLRNILGVVLAVITGGFVGWLDIIWVLLFKHLFLCKA